MMSTFVGSVEIELQGAVAAEGSVVGTGDSGSGHHRPPSPTDRILQLSQRVSTERAKVELSLAQRIAEARAQRAPATATGSKLEVGSKSKSASSSVEEDLSRLMALSHDLHAPLSDLITTLLQVFLQPLACLSVE